MSKEIKKITADEVYPVSMRRLGDRPNSSSAQGRGGMSSAELKGFMDKYPELVKERLNELIDLCNAPSDEGLAKLIKTPVLNPTTEKEFSLFDWFSYAKTYLKGDKGDKGGKGDKGDKGNVLYATFDVEDGYLKMHTPDEYQGAQFQLNSNGYLEVVIL